MLKSPESLQSALSSSPNPYMYPTLCSRTREAFHIVKPQSISTNQSVIPWLFYCHRFGLVTVFSSPILRMLTYMCQSESRIFILILLILCCVILIVLSSYLVYMILNYFITGKIKGYSDLDNIIDYTMFYDNLKLIFVNR